MGVLLLLMTICGLAAATILLIYAFWTKTNWLKSFVSGGVVIWLTGYLILLFAGSFYSEEKTLSFNQPKEFCGFYFDCHLHAAVKGVRRTKTFCAMTAQNEFYIVKVKVFNDAKRASLELIKPTFTVIDAQGRKFEPSEDLTVTIETPKFEEKIPAGGSVEEEIAFDLPADAQNLRLDVREGYGIDHAIEAVLIGDEDSLGHKRSYFKIEPEIETAGK